MHNFKSLRLKIIPFVIVVLLLGVGIGLMNRGETLNGEKEGSESEIVFSEPTNFSKIGTIVFNNPGLKPNTPYLVYEEPGSPALSALLLFDPISVCSFENGATPCIAMSVTLDLPLGGKRTVVEGTKNENTVLVRKIQVLNNEDYRATTPGDVFISWPQAISLIERCKVKAVFQNHSLDIYLTLEDDRRVRSVESKLDEVFRVMEKTPEKCGNIPVATE